MKKIITIIVTLMLFTSTASAQTMYLKNSAWSYTSKRIIPENMMAVYGKGEVVEVIKTKTEQKMAWLPKTRMYYYSEQKQKICLVEKNGVKAWILRSDLTTKKPQYTYKVKNCYRKLTIRKGGKIYDSPKGTKTVLTEELTVYTIGQTNYWYEFYHEGEVYFISKKSSDIISNEKSTFPKILLDGVSDSCIDRVKYQYSLIPQKIRNDIAIKAIVVSNWKGEKETIAGAVCQGHHEIWIRNDKNSRLEYALLHEMGHIYNWNHSVYHVDVVNDMDNLNLSEYHRQTDEYFAEGLELYVRQYAMLKSTAPNLFNYYDGA